MNQRNNVLPITGNTRNRFVQDVVLLHILDPVRGEPTAYGLDQDPHEIGAPMEKLLKRKFLDSFALVCSTKKDGDSVSAACMEEGGPNGTVIRIASNAGVAEETLSQLRELAGVLGGIASRVRDQVRGEHEILFRIIQLDTQKIRMYLKDIRTSREAIRDPISVVKSRLLRQASNLSTPNIQKFLDWLQYGLTIQDLPLDSDPEALIDYIKWAQDARWRHIELLKVAFANNEQRLPRWVHTTFKLGRYGVATKALVQFALRLPALVNPMLVESVPAPPITKFQISEQEIPLTAVLRRVAGDDKVAELVPKLAQVWDTQNAEAHFRDACSVKLVAHAEMQLIDFYDHNRQCAPQFRFIGVSKKSCYLCHLFLTTHPDYFSVSSSHQKIYKSWIPPPALNPKVYKKRRELTDEMSKVMEASARQHLNDRLGTTRRSAPADSTAGVSLSGLTDLSRTERSDHNALFETSIESANNSDSTIEAGPRSLSFPIETNSPSSSNIEIDMDAFSQMGISQSESFSSINDFSKPKSPMVFHIVRSNDASKQDIIQISDILNNSSNHASWAKLVQIMSVDDGFGLAFQEGSEYLFVNNEIRVFNERQLLACIQHLENSSVLNVKASVMVATQ